MAVPKFLPLGGKALRLPHGQYATKKPCVPCPLKFGSMISTSSNFNSHFQEPTWPSLVSQPFCTGWHGSISMPVPRSSWKEGCLQSQSWWLTGTNTGKDRQKDHMMQKNDDFP